MNSILTDDFRACFAIYRCTEYNAEAFMKSIAAAILFATLAGCAVVPVGPPVYVGGSVNYGYDGYGRNHGPTYGPYYGRGRWR